MTTAPPSLALRSWTQAEFLCSGHYMPSTPEGAPLSQHASFLPPDDVFMLGAYPTTLHRPPIPSLRPPPTAHRPLSAHRPLPLAAYALPRPAARFSRCVLAPAGADEPKKLCHSRGSSRGFVKPAAKERASALITSSEWHVFGGGVPLVRQHSQGARQTAAADRHLGRSSI